MTTGKTGAPHDRVDGRAKVTGQARYAGEFTAPDLVHGFVVTSAIARGKIVRIDAAEALALPGVLQVYTHENTPRLAWRDRSWRDMVAPGGSPLRPLHDAEIQFSGQPVALVVAESFELARHAAGLVKVDYETAPHETRLTQVEAEAHEPARGKKGYTPPPKPRGRADEALAAAPVRVEATYEHHALHHNPMEPHATTVIVEADGSLTIHDKTQGVTNSRDYVCKVFGLASDQVRVVTPFVGGGFGSGLRPQYQLFLAVLAARELRRSVRVVLSRQQMFTIGYRPWTRQRVALGAERDGRLRALIHEAVGNTSRFEDYCENVVPWSGVLYECPNTRLEYGVAALDLYTPIDARAPGAVTGLWALESAIDELADALDLDPLALRLKNYAEEDQDHRRPFSSKALRDCYREGAARFGWHRRSPAARSMREGGLQIGWGMATGIWEAQQAPSQAKALLTADGRLHVASASGEIGPGTYTIMSQIAAEQLGLPLAAVRFELGDTALPPAMIQGGSATASSVGSAVLAVCRALQHSLLKLAQTMPDSPFGGRALEDVEFVDRGLRLRSGVAPAVPIAAVMRHAGLGSIAEQATAIPDLARQSRYTSNAHSAVFVEVAVDEALGTVTVRRVVSAVAGGRILNPKTARSQILGGVVWGIGMALEEHSMLDHGLGRFVNHNLGEYHVPVHADVPAIDVVFVEERDDVVNPLGVKGLGEIGIVGVAAAIANAVFHATGRRIRELPITLDKLL
ncbi:xanthine dehydrogenase family protein molybdopterin-binding subunit [Nannocystis pusilla]|uniref:xanthine dehydrogenase family protein molybdopterin-binding subunit n=1 Tax=Nannocystis pusilla TaxID=889268 RepID=UPI003DA27F8C